MQLPCPSRKSKTQKFALLHVPNASTAVEEEEHGARIARKIAAEEGSQRRRRLAAWGLDI
jgi:hypothetical protein